ncbi:MAG: transcriptional regulator NrdR [Lentisphaeria bacterium]
MRCPKCSCGDDKVIDTRVSKEGDSIRRRRECLNCGQRFTTYENITRAEVVVVKRDGSREDFNAEKVRAGVRHACWKRPVSEEQIEDVVRRVAERLENMQEREVASQVVGELVMRELQHLDEVAYVRFASVYRRFKDIDQFLDEIRNLTDRR